MVTTDRLKQLEKENQDKINKKIKEQEMTQKRLDSETKKMNKTISDTKTQIKIIAELETKLQNEEISRQQAIEELRKGDLEDIIKNFKLKSTPKINELVIGIDKNNFNTDEDDNLDGMACELIDKIVVHEAVEKKPNRQQQVDIYYNFIGQFDLPLSEKEIAEARRKAEQEAAEKPSARRTGSVRAMLPIEPKPRQNAGRRMTVMSTRSVSANNAAKSFIRTTQGRGFATPIARKPISKPKKKRNAMQKRATTPSVKRSARFAASPSGRPTVRRCCAPRNAKPSIVTKDSLPIITVSNPGIKPEKQYNSRRTTQWKNSSRTNGQACAMSLSGTTI